MEKTGMDRRRNKISDEAAALADDDDDDGDDDCTSSAAATLHDGDENPVVATAAADVVTKASRKASLRVICILLFSFPSPSGTSRFNAALLAVLVVVVFAFADGAGVLLAAGMSQPWQQHVVTETSSTAKSRNPTE